MRSWQRCSRALLLAPLLFWSIVAVAPAPALADTTAGASSTTMQVSGTGPYGLHLRGAPSLSAAVVDLLPEGSTVQVLGPAVTNADGTWYPVQPAGTSEQGYCDAAFLVAADPPAPTTAAAAAAPVPAAPAQPAAPPTPAPAPPAGARVILGRLTAYSDGLQGGSVSATTSSGTVPHWGTVAADIRLYPYGTRLQIDGFPGVTFTVEDTGAAVHGNVFDVWFPSIDQAVAFGAQTRQVTILP